MQTHTITTYSFNELSSDAQRAAITAEQENPYYLDYDWWDYIEEDARTIAVLFGFDIDARGFAFSGFSSQGDGCCLTGCYSYRKGAIKTVKEYAPQDAALQSIVQGLVTIQQVNGYKLAARVNGTSTSYSNECSNTIQVYKSNDYADYPSKEDREICRLLREFMKWTYKQLEDAYYSMLADDYIRESLQENDFIEYLADGKIYH
jgi:hypothetical protein